MENKDYFITLCVDIYDNIQSGKLQTKRTVTTLSVNDIEWIKQALLNQHDIEKEYKSSAAINCEDVMNLYNKIKRSME